jgi:hypothetical protein
MKSISLVAFVLFTLALAVQGLSLRRVAEEGHLVIPGCAVCPRLYSPVCTADGKKYSNKCYAKCAGVPLEDLTPCGNFKPPVQDRPMVCPKIYKPVCNKNGKMYPNSCYARGAGENPAELTSCGFKHQPVARDL